MQNHRADEYVPCHLRPRNPQKGGRSDCFSKERATKRRIIYFLCPTNDEMDVLLNRFQSYPVPFDCKIMEARDAPPKRKARSAPTQSEARSSPESTAGRSAPIDTPQEAEEVVESEI